MLFQDSEIFIFADDTPPSSKSSAPGRSGGFLEKILPDSRTAKERQESAEQDKLFSRVKAEIEFCIEKELPRAVVGCPHKRNKAGKKVAPDKDCAKLKKAEVGLKCESKLLGRIPYRSRPAWHEDRSKKIEKDKAKLERLQNKQKGGTRKSSGKVAESGEENWLKEF